jgi:hypothetical protein
LRLSLQPTMSRWSSEATLVLESFLNRLLVLTAPAVCEELDRLRFPQKLDVLIALGVIATEARPAWRQVNGLRNRFARDLDARLTEEEAVDLLNCMPEHMRKEIRAQRVELDKRGWDGHRAPRALVANCIGWLATFASREVVERGGQPMRSPFGELDLDADG